MTLLFGTNGETSHQVYKENPNERVGQVIGYTANYNFLLKCSIAQKNFSN